jgi:kynurenine formamidase
MPPFFTRGVLLDPPAYRGLDALPAGEPIDADELAEVAEAQGVDVKPWDVVLIRTGYLKYWPDESELAKHRTAGPDLSAAEWLLEKGVIATGTDTETYEVQPAPDRGSPTNPQPVHTKLLIENGIYLLESLYLEELAADEIYEFLFIALPVKIEGATGSMVDPLAII